MKILSETEIDQIVKLCESQIVVDKNIKQMWDYRDILTYIANQTDEMFVLRSERRTGKTTTLLNIASAICQRIPTFRIVVISSTIWAKQQMIRHLTDGRLKISQSSNMVIMAQREMNRDSISSFDKIFVDDLFYCEEESLKILSPHQQNIFGVYSTREKNGSLYTDSLMKMREDDFISKDIPMLKQDSGEEIRERLYYTSCYTDVLCFDCDEL